MELAQVAEAVLIDPTRTHTLPVIHFYIKSIGSNSLCRSQLGRTCRGMNGNWDERELGEPEMG